MLDLLVKNGPATSRRKRDLFRRVPHSRSRLERPSFGRLLGRAQTLGIRVPNHPPLRVRGGWFSRIAGWCGSLALHGMLILLAFVLVIRAAHFPVQTGRNSTELVLVSDPAVAATTYSSSSMSPASTPESLVKSFSSLPAVRVPATEAVLPLPNHSNPTQSVALPKTIAPPLVSQIPFPKTTSISHGSINRKSAPSVKGIVSAQPDDARNDPPVYPEESRMGHEQGVVLLRVEVSPSGRASRVAILKSSGYFRLDTAARQAVKNWKFRPGSVKGTPVPSEVDEPIRFNLDDVPSSSDSLF